MKRILYALMALAALSFTSCKSDLLDTNPTDQVSGDTMLKTTDGGYMALNGMIRYFWQWGQTTTGNYHQCSGIRKKCMAKPI